MLCSGNGQLFALRIDETDEGHFGSSSMKVYSSSYKVQSTQTLLWILYCCAAIDTQNSVKASKKMTILL